MSAARGARDKYEVCMSDNAIISITIVIIIKVVLILGNNGVLRYEWCYQMQSITFDT